MLELHIRELYERAILWSLFHMTYESAQPYTIIELKETVEWFKTGRNFIDTDSVKLTKHKITISEALKIGHTELEYPYTVQQLKDAQLWFNGCV